MTNQKLYLIPTTPSYEYEPYNHIYLVTASSDQEAYEKAKTAINVNHIKYSNCNRGYFYI